jgi:hypothetical protein
MNSHSEIEEPRTAAEVIARYRDVRRRLYSPATPPKLANSETRTDSTPCTAIAPIPGPSREPEPPPSETPFQHQTPAREALQAVSTRTCVPIADILGRNRRRRSPPLVTRRFGASAWRRAGRCRAWDGSSNATTRPSCTRSARWRSARPAIPNCSPT